MHYLLIDKHPKMVEAWKVFFGEEAMKAALIEAINHPEIEYIAIPGFCTGVGKMQFEIAARQMFQAFLEIEKKEKMDFKDFGEAQKYHWRINPQGMIFE